jgi:HNH endonuclease
MNRNWGANDVVAWIFIWDESIGVKECIAAGGLLSWWIPPSYHAAISPDGRAYVMSRFPERQAHAAELAARPRRRRTPKAPDHGQPEVEPKRLAIAAMGTIITPIPGPEVYDEAWVAVFPEAVLSQPLELPYSVSTSDCIPTMHRYGDGGSYKHSSCILVPPGPAEELQRLVRPRLQPVNVYEFLNEGDSRMHVLAHMVLREGQEEFRQQLLAIYGGRCAITDFDVATGLEASHIIPYRGAHTNDPRNGLLLRADIHKLFDAHKLAIDTATMRVTIAPELGQSMYAELAGRQLRLPSDLSYQPNKQALDRHRQLAIW